MVLQLDRIAGIEGIIEGKTIHEKVFWDDDDHRLTMTHMGVPDRRRAGQIIDMHRDSYIWAFVGTRGAGKGLALTRYAAKAVWLYNKRLVSNYKIKFTLVRLDGTRQLVESEDLDLYKLLCFDNDYRGCLIIMDEAPDIISHMAAQTWKNRLLNIFVRQLRKNRNSLFLAAQFFYLIDKGMRDQVDIIARCRDAFRLYGSGDGLDRGTDTLFDIWDNSGQWTGESAHISHDYQLDIVPPEDSWELPGRPIWGAFDTYETQDVWESLAKVDVHFQRYSVGKEEEEDTSYLDRAKVVIEVAAQAGRILSTDLFDSIGDLTEKERQEVGRRLRRAGAKRGGQGRQYLFFDNLDMNKFLKGKGNGHE